MIPPHKNAHSVPQSFASITPGKNLLLYIEWQVAYVCTHRYLRPSTERYVLEV